MVGEDSTRRSFLGALAASGSVALVGSRVAPVAAEVQLSPMVDAAIAGRAIAAFPAPTAGTRYTLICGDQFAPSVQMMTYNTASSGGLDSDSTFGLFRYRLQELPLGARITEVVCSYTKDASHLSSFFVSVSHWVPGSDTQISLATNSGAAVLTSEQYLTLPIANPVSNWIADDSSVRHSLVVGWWSGGTGGRFLVNSVRIGWIPPAAPLGFYPLAPKRVYDSRRPTSGGALSAGASRVVSVKDGYVNDSDTLDLPSVIPVGARAIAYNLTVTGTTGAGFLSVGPGDSTVAAGSAINWSGPGLSLANGLTATLDGARPIKVFAGPGGDTQFLIDVMGYYA